MSNCGFDEAWIGKCKEQATHGNRCEKHAGQTCASCGKPATRSCDQTGQFVCGAPLCDTCEHTIAADGTNGGIGFVRTAPYPDGLGAHCKPSQQQYKPWYEVGAASPQEVR